MTTVCHDPAMQRRAELVAGPCIAGGRAEFCAGSAARRSSPFTALTDNDRAAVALVIGMLALCAFYGLLALRAHDDNRLTSWLWVFGDGRGMALGPLLAAAVVAAWPLSGLRVELRWAPTLLGLAALGVSMLMWSEPQVIVDTSRYFAQARYLEAHGVVAFLREWGHAVPAWSDLPLVPLVCGLLFRVFGESVLAVQCFTTLCFVGAVLVTCWIGRELWDEWVGWYGGALLLGMPFLLSQVPLMLVDVPTMFLVALAVYAAIKASRTQGWWPLVAAPLIAAALLSKYSAWLMLSVLSAVFLVHRRPGWGVRAAALGAGVAVLVALFLLWKADVIASQIGLLTEYQLPALDRWRESHASTFLFQVHPFVTLAAAASVICAVAMRDVRYLIIVWMVALIFLLDIQRSRYALVAFPMLALMAGYAVRRIGDARLAAYVVLCAAGTSVVVAVAGYAPFLRGTGAANLEQAGRYLNGTSADTVEVIVLPERRVAINPEVGLALLDLATTKRLTYARDESLAPPTAAATVATSPLRFTWELPLADGYASRQGEGNRWIALISDGTSHAGSPRVAERLNGFRLAHRFDLEDRVFRYGPVVEVFEPVARPTRQ
jgi:4-amino-4-deoxy-L-arabinose transferase-like glycosyltransferase